MNIRITNKNFVTDLQEVAAMTINGKPETIKLETTKQFIRWIKSEHSPIRVIQIAVTLTNLSDRVIKHLTRHKIGIEYFVSSRRPDRCKDENEPYEMIFICNPQSIINIARKRLCTQADSEIRTLFWKLKKYMTDLPLDNLENIFLNALGTCMVPDCLYRKSCYEFKNCGFFDNLTPEVQNQIEGLSYHE